MLIILFNYCLGFLKSRTQLQLENVFLRKQLELLNRTKKKIQIKNRDRDYRFGKLFKKNVSDFGINEIVTAYRSPWQNGYFERVIGSIRREFHDHVIVLNENHLRKLLKEYFHCYNYQRTHLGLEKDSPESRPVQVIGKIDKILVANGLHNYYYRNAA